MAEATTRSTKDLQSVTSALQILEYLAEAGGARGVTEIARSLDMPKPRAYRHLRTLTNAGYLIQDTATEKYRLGGKLMLLGQAALEQIEFVNEARAAMAPLRDRVDQTVTISQAEENGIRILDMLRARSAFEIAVKPGALLDFHSSAQGRLALAYGPPALFQRLRQERLRDWTGKTNTDLDQLARDVAAVRRQGWAVAPEQTLRGINALAAPVFDGQGQLAGTITIVGSVQHIPEQPHPEQIEAVLEAARRISRNLGYSEEEA